MTTASEIQVSNRRRVTALIADDERYITTILGMRLQQRGFHVQQAHDGESALSAALTCLPALIILDVDMPLRSGLDVCGELKTHWKMRETPIVMLTGSASRETIMAVSRVGAMYVQKGNHMWHTLTPIVEGVLQQC